MPPQSSVTNVVLQYLKDFALDPGCVLSRNDGASVTPEFMAAFRKEIKKLLESVLHISIL